MRTTASARRLLVAHPGADLYGSDLQLLQALQALGSGGWTCRVVVPEPGPLLSRFEDIGVRWQVEDFPVLRASLLRPRGLLRLGGQLGGHLTRAIRLLRRTRPDLLLVNTLTIPWWIAAGRAAGCPVAVYSHEAEAQRGTAVNTVLSAPLLAAHRVIANSQATAEVLTSCVPALSSRTVVVPNGVPDPGTPSPARRRKPEDTLRCVVVGRLSPRKGTAVALEAVALARQSGLDVRLDVVGSVFPGKEWFEAELRERAARPDLAGAVTFHGYVSPTRPLLEASDVVLAPSFGESFGNSAVEGMLAARPVVAGEGLGLGEVLRDAPRTGVLVPTGDAPALAQAIMDLAADPQRARTIGQAARSEALARFSPASYRASLQEALAGL